MTVTTMAGCMDARPSSAVESLALVPMDTLVATGSELIGGVYDLALSPHGDVHIADYGFKHVLVVGPDGAVRRTIGREGSGPGEFEMPYVVEASGDSVWVLDATSNRVQVFDSAGVLGRSYRVDAPGLGAGRDFRSDGVVAASIEGFENAMIAVVDAAGARVRTFGEPNVPPVASWDFAALKSEIRDGRVPDAFRNRAELAWAPDHSLYLTFLAEPQVRRYDTVGNLLWTRTLDEPVLRAARETFLRATSRNRTRPASIRFSTSPMPKWWGTTCGCC